MARVDFSRFPSLRQAVGCLGFVSRKPSLCPSTRGLHRHLLATDDGLCGAALSLETLCPGWCGWLTSGLREVARRLRPLRKHSAYNTNESAVVRKIGNSNQQPYRMIDHRTENETGKMVMEREGGEGKGDGAGERSEMNDARVGLKLPPRLCWHRAGALTGEQGGRHLQGMPPSDPGPVATR